MPDYNDLNNYSDVVTGVDRVPKKNGKKIAAISAGALAVVLGGGIAAYNFSDYVKNQVKLRFSKPENYFAWVYSKNAEDTAKSASDKYRTAVNQIQKGREGSLTFTYNTSDEVKDIILYEMFGDEDEQYADSEEVKNVKDFIQNLDSVTISGNSSMNNGITSGTVYADINNDRLITYETAVDSAAYNFYMRLPELKEQWLMYDMSSLIEDSLDEEEKGALTAFQDMLNDPEKLLSADELETEIKRYTDVWNAQISDVELEKKATIDICDISTEYTVMTVTLDEQKAEAIAKAFAESAKEDSILRSIAVERTGVCTNEEYDEMIDDLIEEFTYDETYEYDTDTVDLKTYVDPKGTIRGIELDGGEEGDYRFVIGKDGDEIRGEATGIDGGEEIFNIKLTAHEDNDKYTGSIDVLADSEAFTVNFTDFQLVDEEKGYMNGDISIVAEGTEDINIKLGSDGSSQDISADLFFGGKDFGSITLNYSMNYGADPVLPDKNSAFIYSEDAENINITDYISDEELESFISSSFSKLGISKDMADMAAAGFLKGYFDAAYDSNDDYPENDWDADDDLDQDDFDFDPEDADIDIDEDLDLDEDFDLDDYEPDNTASIMVMDKNVEFINISGYNDDSADSADDVKVDGDGSYTVKVSTGTTTANGLFMLAVDVNSKCAAEAEYDIKSVKINGNEMTLSGSPVIESYGDGSIAIIYTDPESYEGTDESVDMIGGENVGEWTDIEITFELKGCK